MLKSTPSPAKSLSLGDLSRRSVSILGSSAMQAAFLNVFVIQTYSGRLATMKGAVKFIAGVYQACA
jgi:hypothetical protein